MQLLTHGVRITGTGSALPQRVVANAELVRGLDTTEEWIRDNLGIAERRVASLPEESTAQLAAAAAGAALARAALEPGEVGGLIVATSTPAQKAPSTACLVQDVLGIGNGSFAFDVQAVCSGFIYALALAASMITCGATDNVVVVGADTFSTITDWDDRACVFFGDGAGAVVLRADPSGEGLFGAVLHADGSGHEGFSVPAGGDTFLMQPRAVYDTGISVLPEAINEVLALTRRTIGDIRYVIPHQPSRRLLDETARRLGVPGETLPAQHGASREHGGRHRAAAARRGRCRTACSRRATRS